MNDGPSGIPGGSILDRISEWLGNPPDSRDQLMKLLRKAQQRKLIDAEALTMIEGVLQVATLTAHDIMVPRAQIESVDITRSSDEIFDFVTTATHTRFPVIEGERDNVIGILHAKDLLREQRRCNGNCAIRDLLRPAVFIPESKRLNVLLRDFRVNRNHLAIVVDEYGGVAGLVTIEDVLEQIVGDIEDEFDHEDDSDHIVAIEAGEYGPRYRIRAITEIEQVNEVFGTHFETDEIDTIGGLLTDHFGRVPQCGDTVILEGVRFEVLRADDRSLESLLAEQVPVPQAAEGDDESG